jgi:hypothetical protein
VLALLRLRVFAARRATARGEFEPPALRRFSAEARACRDKACVEVLLLDGLAAALYAAAERWVEHSLSVQRQLVRVIAGLAETPES